MEDMQSQMQAILQNPEMMEKISALAQSLGGAPPAPPPAQMRSFPDIDPGMLQKVAGIAMQSNIDTDQKNLLQALGPYLKGDRIHKLEKAMRAAKMAKLASGFLGNGGFFGMGR